MGIIELLNLTGVHCIKRAHILTVKVANLPKNEGQYSRQFLIQIS